jgi:hypothetical protein
MDLIITPITSSEPVIEVPKDTWDSCCFTLNVKATKYFIQVGILSGLIIYSSVMLVIDNKCESQRNYGSLLMVCLGTFIPSPMMT